MLAAYPALTCSRRCYRFRKDTLHTIYCGWCKVRLVFDTQWNRPNTYQTASGCSTSGAPMLSEQGHPTVFKGLSVCVLRLHHCKLSDDLATGASAILFLSSVPRVAKGPIPLTLTISSASAALYYGKLYANLR
jgi:hypothetical protein